MAENSSKPKPRDMSESDDKRYLTKSRAELDLERRLDPEYKPDSQVGGTVTVNPNPFGADAYVGTDPIYQNHSTDQNKPFTSEKGVEADALKAYSEEHEAELEGATVAEDYGFGGKARVAETGGQSRLVKTILPGQEGYDLRKAEEQNGPPLRVFGDEEPSESDEEVRADNVGTNSGASTQPPEPPENPSQPDDRGGDATGTKDDASTSAGKK